MSANLNYFKHQRLVTPNPRATSVFAGGAIQSSQPHKVLLTISPTGTGNDDLKTQGMTIFVLSLCGSNVIDTDGLTRNR